MSWERSLELCSHREAERNARVGWVGSGRVECDLFQSDRENQGEDE